jgi:hypothetical protein
MRERAAGPSAADFLTRNAVVQRAAQIEMAAASFSDRDEERVRVPALTSSA